MASKQRVRKNKLKRDIEDRRERIRQRLRFFLMCCGFVVLMGTLSVSLVFAYAFFTQTPYFRATDINVTGNQRVPTEEILLVGKLKRGMNILSLNLGLTRKRLLSHPWIAEAAVQREIPSTIHIRITEQRPVAIVALGKPFLMNDNGELFKALDEGDPRNLPEISGLEVNDFRENNAEPSRTKKAVMAVLSMMTGSKAPFPEGVVRKIHADKDTGISIAAFESEKQYKLGFDNYEFKFKRLDKLMQTLAHKSYITDYQSIDMTDTHRIVVRPSEGDPASS